MPVVIATAWVAVGAAILRRLRRGDPTCSWLEAGVLASATTLAAAGLVGALAGVLGAFTSLWLALSGAALAALLWARTPAAVARAPARRSWGPTLALAVVVISGLGLRAPLHRASLAGRDQGTYVLRARHLLRSGGFDLKDPVLAAAGARPDRPGAFDLLGLYPTDRDPWRRGLYEGAYRPGLYLADRDAGAVVPQFLHMHPALLGLWGSVFGAANVAGILYLYAALSLLAVAAIARRLWPTRAWAGALAAAIFAVHPLTIWVQRTPLTETLALPLGLAALLAAMMSERRTLTAALLGALAWLRGNAWLAAPLLLAILWLRAPARRRAPLLYAALLGGSLVLHAFTVFPYLYDELNRQLGALFPVRPTTLSALAVVGVLVWWLVDRGLFDRHRDRAWVAALRGQLPRVLIVAGLAAIATFLYGQPAELGAPPYSRLDHALAGLGPVLLGLALVGALRLLWRPPSADAWLLAIASVPLTTLALYAQRNLPQAGLFYFGRYLVPELGPLVVLLALSGLFAGLDALGARLRRPRLTRAIDAAAPLVIIAAIAWPLVTQPVVRVHEHAGTERLVEAIAEALPDDAIVVAGGEGWHSSHAFNQVGGALVLGHDVEVLPYRSAEAAYASLHALVVDHLAGDEAPVYLLLGEASHAYTRDDGALVAALDDLLPPPLRARPVGLYELYSDRLTRDVEALPSRVTRSALRLGLFRVEVDHRLADDAVQRWQFVDGEARGPAQLSLKGGRWAAGALCLSRERDLAIALPPLDAPASLVLVAGPGSGGAAGRWRVRVGDDPVDLRPPPRRREQSTLGPFPLAPEIAGEGATIRVRGGEALGAGPCRDGELTELRVLYERPDLSEAQAADWLATSWAPPRDLGHPPKRATWVRGRSLSRLRPGIRPRPTVEGQSLLIEAGAPLRFPPTALPPGAGAWVVHLTRVSGGPQTLEVRADGGLVAAVELPADRRGSWQAPPIPWIAGEGPAEIELRVDGPAGSTVALRDLAFFSDTTLAGPAEPR